MNILILGSGGREHAIAWKVSQSDLCKDLYIAPGNAGTSHFGKNISLDIKNFHEIERVVVENKIGLVIVGPEEPLVNGIVDFFRESEKLKSVIIIGPSKEGARLEGSKDYAKAFMQRHGIPTASFKTFTKNEFSEAFEFLQTLKPPYVLKADGLAAGKGVLIPNTLQEAREALHEILLTDKFGKSGEKIVIEEFLPGIELSVFVLTDGETYKVLPEAKDYKRIGDNNSGPNTGGMGAVSPVPFADNVFMRKVEERIIQPTVHGLKQEGIYYRGFIFIGLMNVQGDPFVIEYNVRMGDPETEVVFPRIKSDVVDLFLKTGSGKLKEVNLEIITETALTVMMVSGGYPGEFEKGKEVRIAGSTEESMVFHAGTIQKEEKILTNGGRVLSVTSFGKSIEEAREKTYRTINKLSFEKSFYRKDIGLDLISGK